MSNLIVRTLHPDEWEDYKVLRLEALTSDPDSFGSTYEENAGRSEDDWRNLLSPDRGKRLFAEIDGDLVSMAGVYYEQADDGTVTAHLIGVYTKPAYRGQGIAAKLIQALIEVVRAEGDADRFELDVNQGAPSAVRLYEKMGFVRGEPVPDYVRKDGATFPQYIMSMRLKKL